MIASIVLVENKESGSSSGKKMVCDELIIERTAISIRPVIPEFDSELLKYNAETFERKECS